MVAIVQKPAPEFTAGAVVEGIFEDVSLADYKGQWVVLLFYPMDFTFVCPTEILAFNDALPQFKNLNTTVLAISTDSKYAHFQWASQPRKSGGLGPDLKLPLVEDRNMKISRDYGVLIEDQGISLRGLFIVDPKGNLRQSTINDLSVGRSIEETIRLIEAYQFTDENGEVCPANWKKGSKTIKATPKESLEYFSKTSDDTVNGEPAAKRPRTE